MVDANSRPVDTTETDVLVVGAGLAGVCVAQELQQCGLDVLVVEAAGRIGGRLDLQQAGELALDAGGAYIGRRHTAMTSLALRHGITLQPTDSAGASLFDFGGRLVRSNVTSPPYNALVLGLALDRIEELSREICMRCPGCSPRAAAFDRVSVRDWAAQEFTHPDARSVIEQIVRELLAAEPTAVSALHFFFYTRSGGGLPFLTAFAGGAQEFRLEGGTWNLARRVASVLRHPVRLGTPVTQITRDSRQGLLVKAGTLEIRCRDVVLATGPGPARAVAIDPGLYAKTGNRTYENSRVGVGLHARPPDGGEAAGTLVAVPPSVATAAAKLHVVYDAPFWQADGLSGWVTADQGPLRFVVDDSVGRVGRGVLVGFLTGNEARAWSAGTVTTHDLMRRLANWFGPRALAPEHVSVRDWTGSPFTQGCYAGVPVFRGWADAAQAAANERTLPSRSSPNSRVWQAGSEYSSWFFGHMEGAVRSACTTAAALVDSRRPAAPGRTSAPSTSTG